MDECHKLGSSPSEAQILTLPSAGLGGGGRSQDGPQLPGDSGGALSMGAWALGMTLSHLSAPELANIRLPPPLSRQALSHHPFPKEGTGPRNVKLPQGHCGGWSRVSDPEAHNHKLWMGP